MVWLELQGSFRENKIKKRILKQIHSFYTKNVKLKKKISQELIKKLPNFSQDMTTFLSVFLQPIVCRFSTYLLLYLFGCWVYLREKVDWYENNRVRLHCFHKSSILKYCSFIVLQALLFWEYFPWTEIRQFLS